MASQSSFSHSSALRYRKLALDIARELNDDELEQVKYLCADSLSLRQRETITTTIQLFGELEKLQRMGVDNLLFLKDLLQTLDRFDLLEKVEDFELERDLGFVVLNSRQQQHGTGHTPGSNNNASSRTTVPNRSRYQRSSGEVTIKCMLELATKGAWVAGSAYIVRRYIDQPEELIRLVSSVVLPTGLLVKYICRGSVKIVTQATDLQSLKDLWQRYNDGRLKNNLEEVFITQELKRMSQGEEISISVHIQNQEYRTACLDLMQAHVKANRLMKSLETPPRRFSCPGFPVENAETDNIKLKASQIVAWHERQRNTLLCQEIQRIKLERQSPQHTIVKERVEFGFNAKKVEQINNEDGENGLVAHILHQKEGDDLCKLLDPPLILGNDWRMLASGLGLKMAEIRSLELTPSPTRSLLELAVTRSPSLSIRELREILRKSDRNDAVKLLSIEGGRSVPFKGTTLLADVPYAGRLKLAHYMDFQKELFYEFAHQCDSSLSYHAIKQLTKAKSPTMALFDQLEAKFPSFTAAEIRGNLNAIEEYSLEEIFETFLKSECNKNAETVRRRLPFQRSRSIRKSIDREFLMAEGTKSTDSGLSEGTSLSNSAASVDIDYGIDKS